MQLYFQLFYLKEGEFSRFIFKNKICLCSGDFPIQKQLTHCTTLFSGGGGNFNPGCGEIDLFKLNPKIFVDDCLSDFFFPLST